MRLAAFARRWSAVPVLLAAAACSDDPAAPSDELSPTEAAELAAILGDLAVEQGFSAAGDGSAAAPTAAPAAVPITFATDVVFTATCPLGGAVEVDAELSGTVDGETGRLETAMTVVQTHRACVAEGGDTGTLFTLDGAPAVTVSMDLESDAQSGDYEVEASFVGAVSWSTDGRSGTCSMDLDVDTSGNNVTGTGTSTVTGSICGITVSQTTSL